MTRFRELIDSLTGTSHQLEAEDIDRLHVLLSEWQVLSDLWIADLVLWLPAGNGRFRAVDHCRPGTGSTIHLDDVVGLLAAPARSKYLQQAIEYNAIIAPSAIRWAGSYAVEEKYVPIVHHGRTIAVLSAEKNPTARPGFGFEVHNWFEELATMLAEMLTTGEYPSDISPAPGRGGTPRVSDGVVWLDPDGVVKEMSPNAHSCFRHLGISGDLRGRVLAEVVTDMVLDHTQVDETLPVVVMGRAAWMTEIESSTGIATLRAFPLSYEGRRLGAILLCRNVTEHRRHERELLSKDATIREIHHRVKNNLQTVSALLRMQARRSNSDEVKKALGQAERRVSTVAHAHEALSHTVDETIDFDEMMTAIMRMAGSVASTQGDASIHLDGSFGLVDADAASSLAIVLAELVTNAIEHGMDGKAEKGTVTIRVRRYEGNDAEKQTDDSSDETHEDGSQCLDEGCGDTSLTVTDEPQTKTKITGHSHRCDDDGEPVNTMATLEIDVIDDGKGLSVDANVSGLGAYIVRTFVNVELHGSIEWLPGKDGIGTRVHVIARIPVRSRP
ncbi:MAG: histidine kinase N-terminal domain-containing protein [Actinomycetaceae bacterium]|nr:histidine kinase N-terminal domain-containing protein [Actinomycetaceae bacterium]